MLGGDVADELHDDHGLAHAGPAVGAHLAALGERGHQVQHLEARLQHLWLRLPLLERRRRAVDGPVLVRLDLTQIVQGLAQDVEQPSQGGPAHRHGDGGAGVDAFGTSAQAVRGVHGQATHPVVAQVLLHLDQKLLAVTGINFDGIIDVRQLLRRELHVHYRADDLHQLALSTLRH